MNCEKVYNLIQQTPMIHFQHDQTGAVLRATEVKPKLDKFIIKKMGGTANVPKEWFLKDTKALNYKMRISVSKRANPERSNTIKCELGEYVDYKIPINKMYFANMVEAQKKEETKKEYEDRVREGFKETVFYPANDKIELSVICFIAELREKINEYIEEFFLVHNFGTRQTKGFGSFIIDETAKKDPVEILEKENYRFFYVNSGKAKNVDALMDRANEIYKKLRNYLLDGFIEDFYPGEQIGSDKKLIKKYTDFKSGKNSDAEPYLFVRALLGLSDGYKTKSGKEVKILSLGEDGFDVERFSSPVTIKIVNDEIIFLFNSFNEICGKIFYFAIYGTAEIESKDKPYNDKKQIILNNPNKYVPIHTPDKFSDEDVIKFIRNFVNRNKDIKSAKMH